MRILVVGGGGREHAMCHALASAEPAPELIIAPGNAGTAELGENVAVAAADAEALRALAVERRVDLVIPGPEAPLVGGLGDALQSRGIPCCGPSSAAARLEGSKAFMRRLAYRIGVPGPAFAVVEERAQLAHAFERWEHGLPVIKADGLAGGKGVFLPDTLDDCLEAATSLLDGELGPAGDTILLEERLVGVEASLFYACHGTDFVALPHARDHKRAGDGDTGPNTGGMGAVSPNPTITPELEARVAEEILAPTLEVLAGEGSPFKGFLFLGLMITGEGPKLLEFNVRLGDPETQAILPRLGDGDFLRLCRATAAGELMGFRLGPLGAPTCAVVLTSDGYPEVSRGGAVIRINPALATSDRWLVHAATHRHGNNLLSGGGRVAAVVARGAVPEAARAAAYEGVGLVRFDGMRYRSDIGVAAAAPDSLE